MKNLRQMDIKQVLVVFLVALATGIVVFGTPPESQAQVTISGVTAKNGSTSFALWSSATLSAAGQTLVLAQNPGGVGAPYNFDISDSGTGTATVSGTATGTGCSTFSFSDTTNVLTLQNSDPGGTAFNEAQNYTSIGNFTCGGLLITVSVGYADNVHSNACGSGTGSGLPNGSATCFPSPFGAGATIFQGSGEANVGIPETNPNHCTNTGTTADNCYDSGVILFTASAAPSNNCPLTQGFWKNHFPGSWPSVIISGGLKIGTITYTAAQLEANLERNPSGGNALVILSHQLITALINIANGSNPTPINATIAAAQSAIDGLNINTDFVASGSPLGQQMTALADTLDSYNNSNLTPTCTGPK